MGDGPRLPVDWPRFLGPEESMLMEGGELDAVPGGCRQYYVEGKGCIYYLVDHGSPNVAERECAARSLARSTGFLRLHPIW